MSTMSIRQGFALSATLMLTLTPAFSQRATPKAEPGYHLSVFATGVTGQYTAPDSIAVFENHVYIAYGNGNDPTGGAGDGHMITHYPPEGKKVFSFFVHGHN